MYFYTEVTIHHKCTVQTQIQATLFVHGLGTGFPRFSEGYVPEKLGIREYRNQQFKYNLGLFRLVFFSS